MTNQQNLQQVLSAAHAAAAELRRSSRADRARWLRTVADALDAATAELVEIADRETHLGPTRLTSEVARTTGQLRLFADVITEGSYLEAIIDSAAPEATPPRPELRRILRPLGPVAVFSASNFPFAFSVAGGDTASALAAGCPVIVKAHSGHLELSRRTAEIVTSALIDAGAPDGVFGLVEGREVGIELASAPQVRAVAFTGSLSGGRALHEVTAMRPDPIPFYGELGSINPVVVMPGAAASRSAELATGLVGSFTLGGGQFCTKPGVVFVPAASGFADSVAEALDADVRFELLTPRIAEAFAPSVGELLAVGSVRVVAGQADPGEGHVSPIVLGVDVGTFLENSEALLTECFGPATLLVEYTTESQLLEALDRVEGSLTATVHADSSDETSAVVETLSERAGRLLFRGWPTGVAVTWSQHHGGPWPATTTTHTSVGATAIRRFLRPIAYQDAPEQSLPADLRDGALASIPHRRDGALFLP